MIAPHMRPRIQLPDSDGQPMADNTLQYEWISTLKWGLELLFAARHDVFVAGDHLIYPVMPDPGADVETEVVRFAPDVYVAFGRPKGYRGSYKVWEEYDIFPQVVFEVWSPSNRPQQMDEKRAAYEEYGAEEYYIVYPEHPAFVEGWVRRDGQFVQLDNLKDWISPRLGIRFQLDRGHLSVIRPDGTPFLTYLELADQRTDARARAQDATDRAEQEANRAEHERARAEHEAKRAESAEQRAARLAAKLRELGLDPDAG